MRHSMNFSKADAVLQIVWGEAYIPGVPDSEGEFMSAGEVRKAAHAFLSSGRVREMNIEHGDENVGVEVVESFVARKNDPDFIEGAWVLGTHVSDPKIWDMILSGELNGYSIEGMAAREDTVIKLDIPREMTGRTEAMNGHDHEFVVRFDENGVFTGGVALPSGNPRHGHSILRGTATESGGADSHNHRFSFVEQITPAQEA